MLATLAALATPVFAGSIAAPGVIGGPDASAATPNPAAVHYNPAAIAAAPGVQVLADAQVAFVRVDIESTRNGGIDPNTGEPYELAKARVQVPVALIGATWQVIPDRLTVGFAATDAFVGGGNYLAGEDQGAGDTDPPYESHQRYAGVMTKILTLHLVPAVGVTVIDGVHVGGSVKYILDSFEVIQASDPLGLEGMGTDGTPYSSDTILQGELSGGHLGWSAGLFFDAVKQAQVGLSYTSNGTFEAEGDGSVILPALLGGGEPEATLSLNAPLPPVLQVWVNSQVTKCLTVGAGFELQMWNDCCGGQEGDIEIGVTDPNGQPLETSAGTIKDVQYSPRRLQTSANLAANAGWWATDHFWIGARVGYNENAVPDYAISATNVDYQNVGAYLAARRKLGPLTVGLSYAKYVPFTRTITNSAWDADKDDRAYVDERFSPSLPFKANTNGVYKAKVDIVGLRLGAEF